MQFHTSTAAAALPAACFDGSYFPAFSTTPSSCSDLLRVPVSGYTPFVRPVAGSSATVADTAGELLDLFDTAIAFIKRTFQPSILKRKRRHGYRARKKTPGGRAVLKRRLLKGRKQLTQV